MLEWRRELDEKDVASDRNHEREDGDNAGDVDNRESFYVSIRETAINF